MSLEVMRKSGYFDFVVIPTGDFVMGAEGGSNYQDETPIHMVSIKAFEMGKYPVTDFIWNQVMIPFGGQAVPKTGVSWDDVQTFLAKLNSMDPGHNYRLPTESEWEYACRAGTTEDGYGPIDEIAWYEQNSECHVQGVGKKNPNAFGLYDMLGNVSEWVQDWYHDDYDGAPCFGNAWEAPKGSQRVHRGGASDNRDYDVRASMRFSADPDYTDKTVGFRLVRDVMSAPEVVPNIPEEPSVTPDLTDIPALVKEVKALRKDIKSIWNLLDKKLNHE